MKVAERDRQVDMVAEEIAPCGNARSDISTRTRSCIFTRVNMSDGWALSGSEVGQDKEMLKCRLDYHSHHLSDRIVGRL